MQLFQTLTEDFVSVKARIKVCLFHSVAILYFKLRQAFQSVTVEGHAFYFEIRVSRVT